MNWNCNIVKDMYDRVIRRRYGLLCIDDTSNEAFITSYLNRLGCKVINTSCYGDNKPCETTTYSSCGMSVNLSYTVTDNYYTFTAQATGVVNPTTYSWNYNISDWILVSQTNNQLVLFPAVTTGQSVTTLVTVIGTDSRGCKGIDGEEITYTYCNTTILPNISFECEESSPGVYTGSATLTVSPSGGTAPYTVTGSINGNPPVSLTTGMVLTTGDAITNIIVTDDNGCVSNSSSLNILCPPAPQACPCIENECVSTETFEFTTTIVNYTAVSGLFVFYFFLDSPSGYTGSLRGSYRINNLSLQPYYFNRPINVDKYYSTCDDSPRIVVNDFVEYGFSELTPGLIQSQPFISSLAGATDSPWNVTILQNNVLNFQAGGPISIDINLYITNDVSGVKCIYSGTIEMLVPNELSTEYDTDIYYNTDTVTLTQL